MAKGLNGRPGDQCRFEDGSLAGRFSVSTSVRAGFTQSSKGAAERTEADLLAGEQRQTTAGMRADAYLKAKGR